MSFQRSDKLYINPLPTWNSGSIASAMSWKTTIVPASNPTGGLFGLGKKEPPPPTLEGASPKENHAYQLLNDDDKRKYIDARRKYHETTDPRKKRDIRSDLKSMQAVEPKKDEKGLTVVYPMEQFLEWTPQLQESYQADVKRKW